MSNVRLKLENVCKMFNQGQVDEIAALSNIDIEFYPGEWVYIVGSNGSGKTTLLRIINAEISVDFGKMSDGHLDRTYFLESNTLANLVPKMTIYENLLLSISRNSLCPSLKSYFKKQHVEYFVDVLSQFGLGLENRLNEQAINLSSGQQQAVAMAKVFIAQRDIVLLDEFTGALDKKTSPIILNALRQYKEKNGATIIAVTHDLYPIQDTADRVVILDSGRIVEVLESAKHSLDAHYILSKLYEK